MLRKGPPAPDFEAVLDNGDTFRLSDYRGRKNVVLYFYPKDFTPGCTREACTFRDNYAEMEQYDAVIAGVSTDSAESHRSFREKHELPFPLIPDTEKRVVKLYKAQGFLGFITARVTYVIDKEGVIRAAFQHDFAIARHLPQVLDTLREIERAPAV